MYGFTKRAVDILISLITLFIFSPLLLIIMIVLLATDEHQIFFTQERVGYKNKKFKLYKFKTMKRVMSASNEELTFVKFSRITKIGKYLRATKIDELPQLVNVLLGQMGIVGPRPLLERDFMLYPKNVQEIIYKTRPGMTGMGSIYFRDEEKLIYLSGIESKEFLRDKILPYKGNLELWYLENKSLKTDVILLLLTAWVLFFPNFKLQKKILKKIPENNVLELTSIEGNFNKLEESKVNVN